MSLRLSNVDKQMLSGKMGPARELAMSIVVKMANLVNAERLIDIVCTHIDSSIYTGDASLEFSEKLAELGAKVQVPSTLNVSSVDENNWKSLNVAPEYAHKAIRQMSAYRKMNCTPIWSCAPYETVYRPCFGDQIAWSESNAIAFANSVIGARTERYSGFMDICIAITGRAPEFGLHIKENRAGQVLFNLIDIPYELQALDSFYNVLGFFIGKHTGNEIPVINNLVFSPSDYQLKSLGAAAASSGGVALFHICGHTPEAATLEDAFQGNDPQRTIDVTHDMLIEAWSDLTTSEGGSLDYVLLGCPHFSVSDFEKLSDLVVGKKCSEKVRFLITTNRDVLKISEEIGYLDSIKEFGAELIADTCFLISPVVPKEGNAIMTDSGKCAYYAPGQIGKEVHFGSLEDCVNSACEGKVIKENKLWRK